MQIEVEHSISILQSAKRALLERDAVKLKELSEQNVHSSAILQDAGNITAAVLIYALSKLVERKDYERIKHWDKFQKKFTGMIDLATKALKDGNDEAFSRHISSARASLTSVSGSLKPYIEEIFRKASINKAGHIYEHGLSLGQTAELLGITQWELSEYTAQRKPDFGYSVSLDVKKRANMALEFFSNGK